MDCFCGKDFTPSRSHLHFALGAAPFSATGRREEYITGGQSRQQRTSRLHCHFLVVVNRNRHLAGTYQIAFGYKKHYDQQQGDGQKYAYA